MNRRHFIAAIAVLLNGVAFAQDYGKPGGPVTLVVGYQPYYTQSWSAVVMRGKKVYEKYLPKGSNVEFQIGLQGAIIVNTMLAGKQHIGYLGDMPSIVATTKTEVADVRMGKYLEVRLNGLSRAQAEQRIEEMCRRLLANLVIEDFRVEIVED